MTNIEKLLKESKDNLDRLEVPEDMESKLRNALDNIPNRKIKRKNRARGKVAALVIATLLVGSNMDTLAYYGKRLIGYENVMDGTLQELNELGKGQSINKSYKFKNGVTVTLDGIMLDDNNLIAFYTINDPKGKVEDKYSDLRVSIIGALDKEYIYGGSGEASEDGTKMRWVIACDAPKFYEKKMKLKIESMGTEQEEGVIEFKLDRAEAMGHKIKMSIDKKSKADEREIKIKSLVASPTATIIKGQIQNILELGVDHIKGERFMPENIDIVLLANGKEVQVKSSGISTDMKGINFYISYDALPVDTKDIEIKLVSFGGNHDTNESIELSKGSINKNIKILGQNITINEVYESKGNTYINITTDENITLSKVSLNIDGEKMELEKTISGDYEKIAVEDTTQIKHTRTLEFRGTGEKLELDIQRMRYKKSYDETIYRHKIR